MTTRAKPKPKTQTQTQKSLEFNHAMIYTTKLVRAQKFYCDVLGFVLVDEYPRAYVRLQSPSGRTTIALHALEPGKKLDTTSQGIRLYFEIRELDAFCAALVQQGIRFEQLPQDMPWGWRHAYLRDPDGHEISLYWAGAARLRPTVMRD